MNKLIFILLLFISCQNEQKNIDLAKYNNTISCQKSKTRADFIIIHIEPSTFDMPVLVIITKDTLKALQYIKDNNDSAAKIEDLDARAVTYPIKDGRPPIIWLPQMDNSPEDISILNHELFHANFSILTWAGVYLSDSTEEVYAYNYQYLTKQFYAKIK